MDKITTLNTLKNVFSALGAKTSDSNYAVGLFDKTSGEPKGLMNMPNLASVLGANLGYYLHYSGSLNPGASIPQITKYGLVVIIERSVRGGCALATFSLSEQKVISDPLNIINDYYTISQGSTSGTMVITNKDNVNHNTIVIYISF